MAAPTLFPLDKRWRERLERWVTPPSRFAPEEYGVDVIPEREAKPFVLRHHYSASYPAGRLAVGLFRTTNATRELAGVAVFAVGIQPRSIPAYTGLPTAQGVELSRFVLLDQVGFNGESWFLARALTIVREALAPVTVVLSYADPMERRDPTTAALTKPAHYGTIYQASNAIYAGRARPSSLILTPKNTLFSRRALSKIVLDEVGRDYARAQLEAAGAPPARRNESPRQWVERLFASNVLRRVRHPGNHVYIFGLTKAARTNVDRHNGNGVPYPKPSDQERRIL